MIIDPRATPCRLAVLCVRVLRFHLCPCLSGGVPPVETFVLGGLLVVLLLITGVFGRLWLRSRRFYPAQEAQLTLSNIHSISEVAS